MNNTYRQLKYRLIELIPDCFDYSFRYHQFGYYLAVWDADYHDQYAGQTEDEVVEWLQKLSCQDGTSKIST